MIKNKFLAVSALAGLLVFSSPAAAQRVIPAGETTIPGTYINICGQLADTSTWIASTTCGALIVKNLAYSRNSTGAYTAQNNISNDPSGILPNGTPVVVAYDGTTATLNVSASTVIKASAGRLFRVNVLTAGSTTGAVHNTTTTGAAAASNMVGVIPNTVGIYLFNWPMSSGIVYIPGTGQVVSISYN